MYDISNGANCTLAEQVINDWIHLVDNQNITKSGRYLNHRGKPLVAIWGLGFLDRPADASCAQTLIDWFRNANKKYQATLLGGVPAGWRDLSHDSKTQKEWAKVYRSFDVISPWTVGRMIDLRTADYFAEQYIKPDLKECKNMGIDYLPVVFPGFSAFHRQGKPLNEIPRNGGTFLWRQFFNSLSSNATMLYIAMFDEVNEGTAIFKIAARKDQIPVGIDLVTFDLDPGYEVPSDWYLQLTNAAGSYLRSKTLPAIDVPIQP